MSAHQDDEARIAEWETGARYVECEDPKAPPAADVRALGYFLVRSEVDEAVALMREFAARPKVVTRHKVTQTGEHFCQTQCEERKALAAGKAKAEAELAAVDAAIADRGVPERDCSLPLPERVSNIISELKNWRHEAGTAQAEVERLTGIIDDTTNTEATNADTVADLRAKIENAEREVAGYKRALEIAKEDGAPIAVFIQEGQEVRVFGSSESLEATVGETFARWLKLLGVVSDGLKEDDLRKQLADAKAEVERLRRHNDRMAPAIYDLMRHTTSDFSHFGLNHTSAEERSALAALDEARRDVPGAMDDLRANLSEAKAAASNALSLMRAKEAECARATQRATDWRDGHDRVLATCEDLKVKLRAAEQQRDAALAAQNARAVEELESVRRVSDEGAETWDHLDDYMDMRLASLRAAKPEPAAEPVPAAADAKPGDEVLRRWMGLDGEKSPTEWLAAMSVVVDELCRRALEVRP